MTVTVCRVKTGADFAETQTDGRPELHLYQKLAQLIFKADFLCEIRYKFNMSHYNFNMKNLGKLHFTLIAFLVFVGFAAVLWQSPASAAQNKPLTYPEIITALNTRLPKEFFKTKADLLRWLNDEVKKRKVDKTLTADREDDLRQAGANDELIETIRGNSPTPPKTAAASTPEPPETPVKTAPTPTPTPDNSPPVKMEFVSIPSGSFEMGSVSSARQNEEPVHTVKINGFQMQKTELTQHQWMELMKEMPTDCRGRLFGAPIFEKNKPMSCAGWVDVQKYLSLLNAKKDGFIYRLPTEAEWEYAARANAKSDFIENLDAVAWHIGNSDYTSHVVALKKPNAFGLYDMLGNVAEWVNDWYEEKYYEQSPKANPPGPKTGTEKTLRGGSYYQVKDWNTYAARFGDAPDAHNNHYGFRLVREKN